MKKKKQWIWTLLMVLYVGFIFNNSITPAIESSKQSGRVLGMVLATFRLLGLDSAMVTEHIIRKMAHFTEYFLMGVLLWNCLRSYMLTGKLWLVLQLWLITVIPLTDETIQLFSEGRAGMISDVWLDVSGAALGSLGMFGAWHLMNYIGEKKRRRAGSAADSGLQGRKKYGKGKADEQKYPDGASI